MNILVAGDFRWNGGSSHVIYNYHKCAPNYGCSVMVSSQYGSLDDRIGDYIPVCGDESWADRVLLVFESFQYLTLKQIERINTRFRREHVTIIDPDGRYGPTVQFGSDSNHKDYTRESWKRLYESLSDCILQPRLSPLPTGAQYFPYFGMECGAEPPKSNPQKNYTIQYVGNNWYRWEVVKDFLSKISPIRAELGRIALKGMRWDGEVEKGFEADTYAEVSYLRGIGVETYCSVAFGQVIDAMGEALVSPLFVRPMIAVQKLITPRMFETLCADTVPVFRKEESYISELYGEGALELCLDDDPAEKLRNILSRPAYYLDLASDIRRRLLTFSNYNLLMSKLLEHLGRA